LERHGGRNWPCDGRGDSEVSTERTTPEAEKAAPRQSEELFQTIFSQAAIPIAQIDLDGKLLRLNDRFCELLGYSGAELHDTYYDATHPDDLEACHEGRRRLRAGEISAHSMEKRLVRRGGAIVWVRRYLSLVRDPDNSPQYFISVVEDITEKVAAEEALRQSELWTRQVFENIPECIFVLDVTLDGRFKFVALNPAEERAVGLSLAEVAGKFIEDVLPEEVSKHVIANYRRCIEAGSLISYEDELNLDIGRRYFHTNLIPLRNAAGRIHRIAGCCTDLTDVKHTQQQALAIQKLESIGVLANGIAHDFNNLLGGILASSELALTDSAEPSPVREQLQRIRTASVRGAEIVRQLMIYGGKESPDFEPVDVSALVVEMLHLLKVSISKHATLKVELSDRLPAVHASPAQIRQVVMNLITNASEAIGEREGVIRATSSLVQVRGSSCLGTAANLPEGDYVQLEISDTGAGMTPQTQANIFDPFFTTKQGGRGLGLSVVRGIVGAHGGAINVVSAPGQGTSFRILLPCKGTTAKESPHPAVLSEKVLTRAGTILVVEDEGMLRSAVAKLLRKRGYSVIEAGDGASALDLILSHRDDVDLILLDVTLPGAASSRDVFEGAQRTRAGLKVILTSAYGKEDIDAAFAGTEIEHFIRKPFLVSDLVALIQHVLST
jgi:two-component system, cell cycle sensor histidine kinase and response regulator CckA